MGYYDDGEIAQPVKETGGAGEAIRLFGGAAILMIIILGALFFGAKYLNRLAPATNTTFNSTAFNSKAQSWGTLFFDNLSSLRHANYTYCPALTTFAQERFSTMSSDYQISHYGFANDFSGAGFGSIGLEEQYFFPSLFSPPGYFASSLSHDAPVHFSGLMNTTYAYYGFYMHYGSAVVDSGVSSLSCTPAGSEIYAAGVNVTQFLKAKGCNVEVANETWLVLEIAHSCP